MDIRIRGAGEHVFGSINNIDLFKSYLSEFGEKANQLVEKAKHNPIVIPNLTQKHNSKQSSPQLPIYFLSPRQIECSQLLIKGLSAKEIARALDISYRTVEKHIEQLKLKLNCSSKSQLLVKLLTSLQT